MAKYNFGSSACDNNGTGPSNGFISEVAGCGVGAAAGVLASAWLGAPAVVGGLGGGALGLAAGNWWNSEPAPAVDPLAAAHQAFAAADATRAAGAAALEKAKVEAAAGLARQEAAAKAEAAKEEAAAQRSLQMAGVVLHGLQEVAKAAAKAKVEAEAEAAAKKAAQGKGPKP